MQSHPKVKHHEVDPMRNLGKFFLEFLQFYGLDFPWNERGVSIRQGGFSFYKRDRDWQKTDGRLNMSIEDPIDISE